MGFEVRDLEIDIKGDRALVRGAVASQKVREQIVLLVGNTEGISSVGNGLKVSRHWSEALSYRVRPGDTLSKISKQFYGDATKYSQIFEANRPMLKDLDDIYPGQTLRIPAGDIPLRFLTGTRAGEEQRPAAESTLAYLHARGLQVEPENLPALFEDALRDMRRTLFPADPAADLSEPEATALKRGGFELAPVTAESSKALARTAAKYAALRDTSFTAGETAQKLGVDPSRVRQLLAARKIYGLQIRGAWKVPVFQFEDDRLLPGLEEVVPALPKDLHPVGVYNWFTTPNPDLVPEEYDRALSPREWLLTGHSPDVVAELAADLDTL